MCNPTLESLLLLTEQVEDIKSTLDDLLLQVIPTTLSDKKDIASIRQAVVLRYFNTGLSYSSIAAKMSKSKIPTKQGGEWTRYTVKHIINRLKKA